MSIQLRNRYVIALTGRESLQIEIVPSLPSLINNKNGSRKKASLPDINTKPEFVRSQSFTQINGMTDGPSGESNPEHSTKTEMHKSDEFSNFGQYWQVPNAQSRRQVFK